MNRRTVAAIALALAALLALAGCDGAGLPAQAAPDPAPQATPAAVPSVPAAVDTAPARSPAPQPTARAAPVTGTPAAKGTASPAGSGAIAEDLDRVLADLEEDLKGVNTLDGLVDD